MVQKLLVSLVDDIDGTAANETVEFGLDGVVYEIDLSDVNAADLREELYRYVEKGRRVGGRKRRADSRSATGESLAVRRDRNHEIRNWGRGNGFPNLTDRGRIPDKVVKAFKDRGAVQPEQSARKNGATAVAKPRVPRKAGPK